MHAVIQSSLSNIAIIFLMHLCIEVLISKRGKLPRFVFFTGMVGIVTLAVGAMFYLPIHYGGYSVDLRAIPLLFFSFMWGWRYVLPALALSSIWSLSIGGVEAIYPVVFGMVLPVAVTLVFCTRYKRKIGSFSLFLLILFTWVVSDFPFLLSGIASGPKGLFFLRLVLFQLTSYILYFFIRASAGENKLKEQLRYFAERDPLTGLLNIRTFGMKILDAKQKDKRMFISMIDIDHFKQINDTFGHLQGDAILRSVAGELSCLVSELSNEAELGRYGGEEFILYMPAETEAVMKVAAERLRDALERKQFFAEGTRQKERVLLTISIGIAEMRNTDQFYEAVELADHSLYKSKNSGRNQIHFAGSTS